MTGCSPTTKPNGKPTDMSAQKANQEPPKYRLKIWGDSHTGQPVFGVQAQRGKGSRWMHCCHGTTPLLYRTREKARQIVRWLNDPKGTEPEWTQDLAH